MAGVVCFNHGKESGPWGSKIQRLAAVATAAGYQVLSPDYRGVDRVEDRVERLLSVLPARCGELILVGSSMGAYVAAAASPLCRPDGLFLLAPAVYLPGYPSDALVPDAARIVVVHGWHDEVVPVDNALRFCRQHALPLLLVDGDHRLMAPLESICRQFRLFLTAG